MQLDTIRLLADDMPAMVRFYRDRLGLRQRFGGEGGDDVYYEFDGSNGSIAVALFNRELMTGAVGGRVGPPGDRALLTFVVDDVDAAFEKLKADGVEVVHPPTDQPHWRLRVAHLRDPAGNLIEIHSGM